MSGALKVGSLFSGGGGFDLGFQAAGFEIAWQVENDRDCISILERHWPNTRRLGDVRDVDPAKLEPVDVVVFGSPCQGFSVAGHGDGLADERSGLFGEAVKIIRGLRPGPALVCWENVPGAFTTGRDPDDPECDVRGRDFAAVLAALANLGALDIAWRVLDSQGVGDCALHRDQSGFWAVPQRRRRIFLVADFGAERASEVLALADGVSRHPAPRRKAGQGASDTAQDRPGVGFVPGVAFTLRANQDNSTHSTNGWNTTFIASEVADTLRAGANSLTGFESDVVALEAAPTLRSHPRPGSNDVGAMVVAPFDERVITSPGNRSEIRDGGGAMGVPLVAADVASTITASGWIVRRLTPVECEALQAWPRDHTRWRADGREIADGPRYRMIGNGVSATVAYWIARRMRAVLTERAS